MAVVGRRTDERVHETAVRWLCLWQSVSLSVVPVWAVVYYSLIQGVQICRDLLSEVQNLTSLTPIFKHGCQVVNLNPW